MLSRADRDFMPVPMTPLPGFPQWADMWPTNAELVAAILDLPHLRQGLADAEAALKAAQDRVPADAPKIAETTTSAKDDLDAYIEEFARVVTDFYAVRLPEQVAVQEAAEVVRGLKHLVTYAEDHEIIDGVAVRFRRASQDRIQITSNADESRMYVEAERNDDGTWDVLLATLDDHSDASRTRLTVADEDAVREVGLAHLLAPMRQYAVTSAQD